MSDTKTHETLRVVVNGDLVAVQPAEAAGRCYLAPSDSLCSLLLMWLWLFGNACQIAQVIALHVPVILLVTAWLDGSDIRILAGTKTLASTCIYASSTQHSCILQCHTYACLPLRPTLLSVIGICLASGTAAVPFTVPLHVAKTAGSQVDTLSVDLRSGDVRLTQAPLLGPGATKVLALVGVFTFKAGFVLAAITQAEKVGDSTCAESYLCRKHNGLPSWGSLPDSSQVLCRLVPADEQRKNTAWRLGMQSAKRRCKLLSALD